MGAYGVPPYKSVMHCGFTMDAEGKKMSKSAGNGVDPADVMAKSGADVLRLWVASVDYSQDVNIGDEILERTSEAYRRIRNTFRFLLGSLDDFDDRSDAVAVVGRRSSPSTSGPWCACGTCSATSKRAYDAYKFHMVYRAVYDYIVSDLSAVYMDAREGPPVLRGARLAAPPRRADRAHEHPRGARARARARAVLHHRRGVGALPRGHALAQADVRSSVQLAGWPEKSRLRARRCPAMRTPSASPRRSASSSGCARS